MVEAFYERLRKADRRRHPRFITSFKGRLTCEGESRTVVVGDLSAGGAMIEDHPDFWPGRKVELRAKKFHVHGQVRWKKDGICGLSFDKSIDPLLVIEANAGEIKNIWSDEGIAPVGIDK